MSTGDLPKNLGKVGPEKRPLSKMELRWQNTQHHFGLGRKQPERRYYVMIDDKSTLGTLQKLKITSTAFKAPYTGFSGGNPVQASLMDKNKKPLQVDVIEVSLQQMQEIRKHTENELGPCVMVGGEPTGVTRVRGFKAAVQEAARK